MLRKSILSGTIATLSCLASLPASAQETTAQVQQNQTSEQITPGILDEKTSRATFRASELIGMNIQNDRGESVGEINDLVIDGNSGQIRYAAVTYGGFLGLGNKLFAVPYEAFKVGRERDDPDDYVLLLNVTKQQLEGAQGFDEDRWPDMANENWAQELDKRYGVDRSIREARRTRDGVNVRVRRNGVEVDRPGVDVDVDRD